MLDFILSSPLVIGIIGAVTLLILVAYLIVSRIKVAGPNEAYIITGRKGSPVKNPETGEISHDMSGQKVVMGASVFVLPFVQRLHVMDLSSRRISVSIRGAVSSQGIKCDLDGVAVVKVGGNEDAIRAAAQRFLTQQTEVDTFTTEVLAGSLRAIVGRLTIEEIIKDRATFASAVAEEAETSLTNQGLTLDTFQLQDIQAEGEYLTDLGRPEAARVEQSAKIAEARANQAAEEERLRAEEAVAIQARQLELKKAEIKAETDEAQAQAGAAGPLREAARNREVIQEQELVAEREAGSAIASWTPRSGSPPTRSGTASSRRPRRGRTPPSSTPRPRGPGAPGWRRRSNWRGVPKPRPSSRRARWRPRHAARTPTRSSSTATRRRSTSSPPSCRTSSGRRASRSARSTV